MNFAWARFARFASGWARFRQSAILCHHLRFDYQQARSDRTALDAFKERVGVRRDFTHLAITLCRCLNIPARYVTGYLGDIGGFRPWRIQWILALGLRSFSAADATVSMLAITNVELVAL